MFRKATGIALVLFVFSACASSSPRIIQTMPGTQEVRLVSGIATQIELPETSRVQSVVIGNPSLAAAEQTGNVVNLIAKDKTGETNMIIRSVDEDGHSKIDQYRITVQQQ